MTAVATLAVAEETYLAAAEAHILKCGSHENCPFPLSQMIETRAQDEAFRAAIDAALAVERERTARQVEHLTVALRHRGYEAEGLRRENGRLRGRIVGGVAAIRNGQQRADKPGHAAVALSNALLALESSADEADLRREAMLSGRHPAGRDLRTDQP